MSEDERRGVRTATIINEDGVSQEDIVGLTNVDLALVGDAFGGGPPNGIGMRLTFTDGTFKSIWMPLANLETMMRDLEVLRVAAREAGTPDYPDGYHDEDG